MKKSGRAEANTPRLRAFLTLDFEVWAFWAEDSEEAASIRAYDVLIAAQARRRGARLVTANVGEFRRVEGLVVEDWVG